jgi:hypothetical protein
MRPLEVRIDRIAVEIDDAARVGEVEATVRKALALLASRLRSLPGGTADDVTRCAFDLLAVGPVDARWLAGPAAAAELADELYARIVEEWR